MIPWMLNCSHLLNDAPSHLLYCLSILLVLTSLNHQAMEDEMFANSYHSHLKVSNLVNSVSVPVTCKCRIYDDWEKTLQWVRMLESTGIVCLAVHGRTRDQKPNSKYRADWNTIRRVREILSIPVIANGNVRNMDDIEECLRVTGAVGVMSAETLLENPALFSGKEMSPTDMALDYMEICKEYTTPMRMVRAHIFQMLHNRLSIHTDVRARLQEAVNWQDHFDVVSELKRREMLNIPGPCESRSNVSAQTDSAGGDVSLEGINLW
eukprot:TRINITY_DN9041_c0_g1_i1.p1 TRINITY_DN9041_c0_g1~~TRINITY_DN9041_c0_g1_i1.p1  ORF type:complete len:265 (+),score=26.15 TRINITY_DN9041_c0_g1_i1:722-1516(+)